MANAPSLQANRWLLGLEGTVLVVGVLYFARPILMPVALAVLISFALTPAVSALQRRGLHRLASVGVVVLLLFTALGLVGWKTVDEFSDLLTNLPTYRQNLREKIGQLKAGSDSSVLNSLEQVVSDVSGELQASAKNARRAVEKADPNADTQQPVAVRVVPDSLHPLAAVQSALMALAAPILESGLVLVLVIFMLCAREDIRNRVMRLAGTGRLTLTTRTLDELGTRVSSYLMTNAIVNGGFGVVVGLGLYAIGVQYAVLWGFLAAMFRFLPYIGGVLGSSLPIVMAIIQSPSWTEPLLALGLFIVVELITNYVVEPLTYGKSSGVSAVALLVAAIFWSWIWGPIGLILSVPLTVVLAVLGKYVPPLEPLWILLGDAPPLKPDALLYQRLLAGDADEAAETVDEFARDHTALQICDDLLIPAMVRAQRDRSRGELTESEQQFVWSTIEHMIDEFVEAKAADPEADDTAPERTLVVVGVPAVNRGDELTLNMLVRLTPPRTVIKQVPLVTLASELVDQLADSPAQVICISALGPAGIGQTRYLCKRIRQRYADLRILVGRWGYPDDSAKMTAGLEKRGASQVVTSLAGAVDALERILPAKTPVAVAH